MVCTHIFELYSRGASIKTRIETFRRTKSIHYFHYSRGASIKTRIETGKMEDYDGIMPDSRGASIKTRIETQYYVADIDG